MLGDPLRKSFDVYASFIITTALFVVSLLILFELPLGLRNGATHIKTIVQKITGSIGNKKPADVLNEDEVKNINLAENNLPQENAHASAGEVTGDNDKDDSFDDSLIKEHSNTSRPVGGQISPLFTASLQTFALPPLSLLEGDRGRPGVGDIKANANIIKRTLANFGIVVEMDEISIGPSVTRYALKPAEGVRLQKIITLQQNLELALAAHPVRIEAPIPGKSLVGIEVPNSTKSIVGLGAMLGSPDFQKSEKPLYVALGRGISGESYFSNLAKMPHLLVAGATGSGKSVMIHNLLTSLLYRNAPDNLRFIMVDPKRVELTLYNKIPHLLHPVITDAKKAILALRWAAKEMDRRYNILEAESVRDIDSYHKNVLAPALKKIADGSMQPENSPEAMPYIVIVVDELADIMQSYPRELEAAIVRLAQMSRAVGIHLIISTQRPSVNVITGLIKANVPGRIAMQVASQIDSRTILDMGGAEKLLGAGDMLYLSADMSQPARVQSAYITEHELKKVVAHLIKAGEHIPPNEINLTPTNNEVGGNGMFSASLEDGGEDVDDAIFEEAREAVIKAGKASTSYLQRRLRIGYSRAARVMDLLEERGVIGPQDGAKPRDVLIKNEMAEGGEELS
jgi:S-DNA-T family DNA segregation ATPase FtsK/SpoIIIE